MIINSVDISNNGIDSDLNTYWFSHPHHVNIGIDLSAPETKLLNRNQNSKDILESIFKIYIQQYCLDDIDSKILDKITIKDIVEKALPQYFI